MSKDISKLQAELDDIIAWFQSDQVDINQAEAKYKRGLEIASEIKQQLSVIENNIKQLKVSFDEGA